ncbi:hypothetical protein HanPSC8_Chr08g0320071 [Helianthus annuus]|nr:hypothetical protein HanPSC8_Chr08g0320071 [Helianthus annuus]
MSAFIKRGQESGYTKITLRGNTPDEKIVIICKIDAHNRPTGYIRVRTR